MENRSFKSRLADLKGKIGSLLRKVGLFFKPSSPPAAPPAPQPKKKDSLDTDDFFTTYLGRIGGLNDVVVKLGLYDRLYASQEYIYEMGRRDGSLGVRLKDLASIAQANAKEIFRHIHIVIRGKLASLTAEFNMLDAIRQFDEKVHEHEQTYYNYVKYQYRFFPRSYSFWLFVLYLTISFLLMIADIPLALKLINSGFNLDSGGNMAYLFVGNTRDILAKNWESITTSVGIALCSIYIKIYYDEFIGTPFASRLMTFHQFLTENDLGHMDEVKANVKLDEVKADIKSEVRHKSKWKLGLLIFTILCIIALACLRLDAAVYHHNLRLNVFSAAAVIAITLLFPVISGICLSYALNNIQNLTRLWKATRKAKEARAKWMRSNKAATIMEKDYHDMVAAETHLGNEERMVAEYQSYLVAFYERGYAIGSMQPEKYIKGEDFFTKVLEWRNIAISRKINNHINSLN